MVEADLGTRRMVEVELGRRSEVPRLGPVVATGVPALALGLDACLALLG